MPRGKSKASHVSWAATQAHMNKSKNSNLNTPVTKNHPENSIPYSHTETQNTGSSGGSIPSLAEIANLSSEISQVLSSPNGETSNNRSTSRSTPSQEKSPTPNSDPKKLNIIHDNSCGENYNPPSNFRLANQKILLTYKSHLPKNDFKQWLSENCGGFKICEMAHEVGKNGGESGDLDYDHTHVLIDFGRIFQTTNSRRFDYTKRNDPIHPHVKKIKNKTHWDRCCNYLAKEDPDNAHLKRETNIVTSVFNSESLKDALLSNAKKFSDVSGITQLYSLKPTETLDTPKPDIKWGIELINYLENNKPDFRKIIWVYDFIGNTGKSWVVDYLCDNFPDKYTFTTTSNTKDNACVVDNSVKNNNWNGWCIFFDFPRDIQDRQFYETIENVKNGRMTVGKYNSHNIRFQRPHIVVMANFLPNIHRLSKDKWQCFEILSNGKDWRVMSLQEVDSKYKQDEEDRKNGVTPSLFPQQSPATVVIQQAEYQKLIDESMKEFNSKQDESLRERAKLVEDEIKEENELLQKLEDVRKRKALKIANSS